MGVPTLFLYNLDNPKGAKIRRMCLPLKIRTKLVAPEAFAMTLDELTSGAQPDGQPAQAAFSDEMLLMADFTSAQVDALLAGFRRAKIPPVALKAVLTPTNRAWDSVQLHRELAQEHQAMREGRRAEHSKAD